jgi:hypothetical protein
VLLSICLDHVDAIWCQAWDDFEEQREKLRQRFRVLRAVKNYVIHPDLQQIDEAKKVILRYV